MEGGDRLRAEELRFGLECEFTEPATANVRAGVSERYRDAVRRRCGGGRPPLLEAWRQPPLRVTDGSNAGFHTRLFPHRDNGVLEIATEPLSLAEFRRAEPLLEDAVWRACRDVGLAPGTDEINRWSMHVNVSWPALAAGRDGDLLLRYVADFHDHPELALGGLGGDIRNAPPLAILGARPRAALRDLVNEHERLPDRGDAFHVARELRSRVFRERFVYGGRFHNDFYHAVNVCHVRPRPRPKRRYAAANAVRIEIRASYMQPSAAHALSVLEIVAARLCLLARRTGPIRCVAPAVADPPAGRLFRPRGVQDGVTADRVAACWIGYVREAGLDPTRHAAHLVNPDVRAAAAALLAADRPPARPMSTTP